MTRPRGFTAKMSIAWLVAFLAIAGLYGQPMLAGLVGAAPWTIHRMLELRFERRNARRLGRKAAKSNS